MKGKYITTQLTLTCLSQQHSTKRDIHAELQEIVDERKEIIKKMQETVRKTKLINMYLTHFNAA